MGFIVVRASIDDPHFRSSGDFPFARRPNTSGWRSPNRASSAIMSPNLVPFMPIGQYRMIDRMILFNDEALASLPRPGFPLSWRMKPPRRQNQIYNSAAMVSWLRTRKYFRAVFLSDVAKPNLFYV